jgi:PP-loop superfamily ATP-utilizing enzyme
LPRAIEHRDAIVAGIRSAGYRHVTLDLAGFRREADHAEPALVQLTLGHSR